MEVLIPHNSEASTIRSVFSQRCQSRHKMAVYDMYGLVFLAGYWRHCLYHSSNMYDRYVVWLVELVCLVLVWVQPGIKVGGCVISAQQEPDLVGILGILSAQQTPSRYPPIIPSIYTLGVGRGCAELGLQIVGNSIKIRLCRWWTAVDWVGTVYPRTRGIWALNQIPEQRYLGVELSFSGSLFSTICSWKDWLHAFLEGCIRWPETPLRDSGSRRSNKSHIHLVAITLVGLGAHYYRVDKDTGKSYQVC